MSENLARVRKANLMEAIITFSILIVVMAVGIIAYDAAPHMPMFIGVIVASLMALQIGYKWEVIEQAMFHGITQALQAIVILAIIGILIGVWILSGVVPSMIYYGLGILSPKIFLVATVLICSITSLATGTSWGTAGTMGIALMGISQGLGIPAPITAGAVISGAYFGDKMSPLSDTTNLAPAMAGTDVFTHVKFMMFPTAIAYGITLLFFGIMGMRFGGGAADVSAIETLRNGIAASFHINPVLILPPLLVITCIAFKMPAIPGITVGILAATILGFVFQGINLGELLKAGLDGYKSTTGIEAIDNLLTAGGLMNMMYSISLTILAMMFGGIMEKTGQLEVIVNVVLSKIRTAPALVWSTMLTCLVSNATMPEQYIALVVPGRMYANAYKEMGLHPKTLSNALESSGTVVSPLIPWNTCGVFLLGVLGVSTFEYFPYAIFNYTMPLVVGVLAYLGPTVAWQSEEKKQEYLAARKSKG